MKRKWKGMEMNVLNARSLVTAPKSCSSILLKIRAMKFIMQLKRLGANPKIEVSPLVPRRCMGAQAYSSFASVPLGFCQSSEHLGALTTYALELIAPRRALQLIWFSGFKRLDECQATLRRSLRVVLWLCSLFFHWYFRSYNLTHFHPEMASLVNFTLLMLRTYKRQ